MTLTHPETQAELIRIHKAHMLEAIETLCRIKEAVIQGDTRPVLVAMCSREIRELTNLHRTGRRCPDNVLEVSR